MDWWIVVLVLGELLIIGWLAKIAANYVEKRHQQRIDERLQMLQRFSAEELSDFLATEQGHFLIDRMSPKSRGPWKWILAGTAIGFVAAMAGVGLVLSFFLLPEDKEGILLGGLVSLFSGFGFLLASFFSLHLSRKWGLHPQHSAEILSPASRMHESGEG